MTLQDLAALNFKLPTVASIKLPSGLEVETKAEGVFVVAPGPYSHLVAGRELAGFEHLIRGDGMILARELAKRIDIALEGSR